MITVKPSGVVINTFPWVKGETYQNLLHIVKSFEVNIIFVLDQERLYHELIRDLPSTTKVLYLPKSGGVLCKTRMERHDNRDLRIKEYFYGGRIPLYPFSFEMKFSEMKLFRVGAPSLPESCMPIGTKVK